MKKLVLLFVCMFAVSTMTMADNDKPIPVTQLPAKAQTFLQTYFKDSKVALSKQESDLFYKSYDVVFTNGEEVEFDKSGEWTEIEIKITEPTWLTDSMLWIHSEWARYVGDTFYLSAFTISLPQ